MKKNRWQLAVLFLVALLAVLPGCDSSDPVALEGDEIDMFPYFLEADLVTGEFRAIIMALVRDPVSGVRRDGVEVLFRITTGSGILSRLQVVTNDAGEAFVLLDAEGSVTVEAISGNARETVDLDASGGSIGENTRPTASMSFSPSSPRVNQSVTFDVSDSSDPDGTIDTWQITEFGDGESSSEFDFGDRTTTTHTYGSAGDYDVTLRVTDNGNANDDVTVTVSVSN